jgi:hypothetical protein
MKVNLNSNRRWIGLVAAALTVLLVLPLMMADEERPVRVDREDPRVERDDAPDSAARDRGVSVRGVRGVRPGVGGLRDPRDSRGRTPGAEPTILAGVMITDTDPSLIQDPKVAVKPFWNGPFDGPDTLNLYVVTLFDATQLSEEFDLVTRFVLPDGHTYERRVVPVDPRAKAAREVSRPDIAPHPVAVRQTAPAGRMAEGMVTPAHVRVPEQPTFVTTVLPCSGTWITQHGLYGTWTVQAIIRRDGKDIEMSETTFDIHR